MGLYTRRQLTVLLLLLAVAGLGLAVGHLRRTHPDLVDRLETLDREWTGPPAEPPRRAPADPPARPAKRAPVAAGQDAPPPVDLNRATASDLVRLPGIGPVLAARILETRETAGPFASPDDLRRVRGVSRAKLERVRPLVTVAD